MLFSIGVGMLESRHVKGKIKGFVYFDGELEVCLFAQIAVEPVTRSS